MLKRISSTTKTVEQLPTQQEETGEEEEEQAAHQVSTVQYSTVQYRRSRPPTRQGTWCGQ